ncbi:uncharacterized protein [Tenebrio molitor]|uniref:uncharacterized protein n=1 Tax=Tenebrio molitor TaxID=7067 RepID=UPI003624A51A
MAVIIGRVEELTPTQDNIGQLPRKVAILISFVGAPTYKLLRDLCYPDLPKSKTYAELCQLLVKQYSPQVSEWRERIKFYDLQHESNESISEWYARIRNASVNCNFGAQLTEVLKNKFVVGLRKTQKRESALEGEINRIQKNYPPPPSSQKPRPNDNRQHSRGENNPKSQADPAGECKHCDKRHGGKCRFAYYKCNKCSKIGHIEVDFKLTCN